MIYVPKRRLIVAEERKADRWFRRFFRWNRRRAGYVVTSGPCPDCCPQCGATWQAVLDWDDSGYGADDPTPVICMVGPGAGFGAATCVGNVQCKGDCATKSGFLCPGIDPPIPAPYIPPPFSCSGIIPIPVEPAVTSGCIYYYQCVYECGPDQYSGMSPGGCDCDCGDPGTSPSQIATPFTVLTQELTITNTGNIDVVVNGSTIAPGASQVFTIPAVSCEDVLDQARACEDWETLRDQYLAEFGPLGICNPSGPNYDPVACQALSDQVDAANEECHACLGLTLDVMCDYPLIGT